MIARQRIRGHTWSRTLARGDGTPSNARGSYAVARTSRPTAGSKSKESVGPELEGHTHCHGGSSGARKLGGVCDEESSCNSRRWNHIVPTSYAGKPTGTRLLCRRDGPSLCV